MIFNYEDFMMELFWSSPEKRSIIDAYIDIYGSQETIEEEPFYVDYLSRFNPIEYNIPEDLGEGDFDYGLLLKLIAGSLSSTYKLIPTLGLPELEITVTSGDEIAIKRISELYSFQILSLFEIYVTENLNMAVLANDPEEADSIIKERERRIERYRKLTSNLSIQDNYKKLSQTQVNELSKLL